MHGREILFTEGSSPRHQVHNKTLPKTVRLHPFLPSALQITYIASLSLFGDDRRVNSVIQRCPVARIVALVMQLRFPSKLARR